MINKIKEWISLQLSKNPGRIVLFAILMFNILFFLFAAVVISNLALAGTEKMGVLEAAFYTVTMILDAGCIQFVVADIGQSGVFTAVVCLIIIIIGMITFTGAVIGYITNYISNFIDNANAGTRKLRISDHTVILNWNTRASEIINDLLYCDSKRNVVVLVPSGKTDVEKEIFERLSDTIMRENALVQEMCAGMSFFKKLNFIRKNRFKNNVTVIVREGDVFSSKQLHDISLEKAKNVIILSNDIANELCKFGHRERLDENSRGNTQTIKTLMQVADITSAAYSNDEQNIVVEITDDWTSEIVDKIVEYKRVAGKCNIVPVKVNQTLGRILSQFSLMPELNFAYKELFSNKGAAFYASELSVNDGERYIKDYLKTHRCALPLTFMTSDNKRYAYYTANSESDISAVSDVYRSDYTVDMNRDYWIERKNVIILGHNSRCEDIMRGFTEFCGEWGYSDSDEQIVRVVVVDDQENLEKMDYYKKYPFVIKTVPAEIYDNDRICDAINEFISSNPGEDTSILILSDDSASSDNIDANALANLVYVQNIINYKKAHIENFDPESIDVIVEIINPKHHDIVSSYSVNNVVISNRYISKMMTQIGEKEALFDFYCDILTYDAPEVEVYESKEVYIKKVSNLFNEVPGPCTADELIQAIYSSSIDESLPPLQRNPTIALGYVSPGGKMTLFSGDRSKINVKLDKKDKLIVFSTH